VNYLYNFFFSIPGFCYILIWILVFFATILTKKKIFDHLGSISILLFSFVFLGCRDEFSGTDTYRYVQYFNNITSFFDGTKEPGYGLFTIILKFFGNWQFFLVANVLVQLFILYLICVFLELRVKSVVLLFYISMMPGFDMLTNGLRQGLAISFGMLVWTLAFYKNYVPKIFFCSVLLFHKSMLSFIPAVIFGNVKNNRFSNILFKYLVWVFLIFILFYEIFGNYLGFEKYFQYLSFDLLGSTQTVDQRLETIFLSNTQILVGYFKYYFLLLVLFFIVFISMHRKYVHNNPALLNLVKTFNFLAMLYAVMWISPHSYRFMYLCFLPGTVVVFILLKLINRRDYYGIIMFLILISSILVYSSNTFKNFTFNL